MNINTVKHLLKHPARIVPMLGAKGMLNWMPDKLYLQLLAKEGLGYWIDFKNPKTFNEKLNWLKLYDRKPLYTQLADKYAVRAHVAEKLGEEYLIPLVGGPWNSVDDIDFAALPEQFVLKTTHDSGGVVICRNKAGFDIDAAKAKLGARLGKNYFWGNREWPYKNIKPRIIAEKYMEDASSPNLPVYKIFCFTGKPGIIQTIQNDKRPDETIDYFDTDWNLLELRQNFPNSPVPMSKPHSLDEMLALAEKLSAGHAFLRADFYNINGKVCFSEITFYSDAGLAYFEPAHWDETLGQRIELPKTI